MKIKNDAKQLVQYEEQSAQPSRCHYRRIGKMVLATGAVAIGAAAAVNALIAWRTPPVGSSLGGVFGRYPARHGDLAYTVSGTGPPLLLLHAPTAGNSMAEWAQNFEVLSRHFTVYALDYLGWGLSDKPQQSYEADDLVEQVQYFVEDVINAPTAVIASGQSCGIALKAAHQARNLFSNLVLVCPASASSADDFTYLRHDLARKLLSLPVIGTTFYNFLVSRRNLDQFAVSNLYFDEGRFAPGELKRLHTATHQRGAKASFLSVVAGLLQVDARDVWSRLEAPALLVWGRNAFEHGLDTAPEWLALNPEAELVVIDNARLLPHEERSSEFNEMAIEWLKRHQA